MTGPRPGAAALARLLARVRDCRVCAGHLPHPPRPVLRASATAKLMIVGQAPGTAVHQTGVPFDDPSGDTLRAWLGLDREAFYDEARIAIVATGFCYPGKGKSGDAPPRPECAPLWHADLRALMPDIALTLLVGAYAQAHYLGDRRERTLAATVRNWRAYGPEFLPIVHPSPRNRLWLRRNPWFEAELVPQLRTRIAWVLGTG